jgi:ABC-2 type transport system ATP-binding protein
VSFSCPSEQISCILGPNGAGKTTIIKILAGLVLPDSGKATILDLPLYAIPVSFRSRIGLATPNERSFYWRLTGRQNLDFFASLHGLKKKERKQRVSELLSEVELSDDADKPYRLYSAGMKQKLLLARAILGRPDILLLDEPTNHLDPNVKKTIHRLIRERFVRGKKITVLLCTHDLSEATEIADHLIFLNEGRVKAEGTLSSLRSKLQPQFRLVLEFLELPVKGWQKNLQLLDFKQEGEKIVLEVVDRAQIPKIIKTAVAAGGSLLSCQRSEESLSKIFERLTTGEDSG